MRFRRRVVDLKPSLSAYKALDQYVLLPSAKDASGPALLLDHDRMVTLPGVASDVDLGTAAVTLLVPPRSLRVEVDEHWHAQRRRLLKAFGVKTDRAWLSGATCASVELLGETVRISAWRHQGQRHNWVGRVGDPVAEAAITDVASVGRGLREMLSIELPPG